MEDLDIIINSAMLTYEARSCKWLSVKTKFWTRISIVFPVSISLLTKGNQIQDHEICTLVPTSSAAAGQALAPAPPATDPPTSPAVTALL